MKEKNFDFRKRMRQIHRPGRRNAELQCGAAEVELTSDWKLVLEGDFGAGGARALADIQDYLLCSMGVSVCVGTPGETTTDPTIRLKQAKVSGSSGSFILNVSSQAITLSAADLPGLWNAIVYVEDTMNLREAPFLPVGHQKREPLIKIRRTHSGYAIDSFPDWHLCAIVHAGFTTIEVYLKDFDCTAKGYQDVNDLIDRAAEYGLNIIIYNYMSSFKHPDDPDADEFFDSIYGEIFRRYPGAAGIKLVGESLEFPSKDPVTTGKKWKDSVKDGIPDTRPSPGWWPCTDYPDYLRAISRAIRKVKPDAMIIFNTYNWGYTSPETRRKFLENVPRDIIIQTTFEIFKIEEEGGLSRPIMDYTISAAEPGDYFKTECAMASELGLEICATTNTIGASWDFGCVPYVPTPYRWIERFRHLEKARIEWGLSHHYETHHYGWWPNVTIDLRKANIWAPRDDDLEGLLQKIAIRDFGKTAANRVLDAWKLWSEAMDYYVASNEDQYGPWRVGPAYPFIFQPNVTRTMRGKEIDFPTPPHAHFGGRIVKTLYQPYENEFQSPGPLRFPKDIKRLEKMLLKWNAGLTAFEQAMPEVPRQKLSGALEMKNLAEFIRHFIITTINIKRWWLLNTRLQASDNASTMMKILDELETLAAEEMQNVEATISIVEKDSRLGWEPSMEYVCDKWHLEWKLRQVESALREIKIYRIMLRRSGA